MSDVALFWWTLFATWWVCFMWMGLDDITQPAYVAYAEDKCAINDGWIAIEHKGVLTDHIEVRCKNGARFEDDASYIRNSYVIVD